MDALLAAVQLETAAGALAVLVEALGKYFAASRTTHHRVRAGHLRGARAEGLRLRSDPLAGLLLAPVISRIHVAALPIFSVTHKILYLACPLPYAEPTDVAGQPLRSHQFEGSWSGVPSSGVTFRSYPLRRFSKG